MDNRIASAKQGRELWLSLVEQYNIGAGDYVILLPHDDKEINELALRYLDAFLEKRFSKRAIVLSYDSWVRENMETYTDKAQFVEFDRNKTKQLMQFYCLYEFAANLIIASLEYPAGRLGTQLIGHKGLSQEEVFKAVVYRLF